ncbi:MAG: hypothetical protein GY702_11555 [Desulfobulbaceae bacterium]|nr:hypothetical protein [Desulfobulbaceae bacterium]
MPGGLIGRKWGAGERLPNINTTGSLATSLVSSDQVVTITVQYKGLLDTHTVTIKKIDILKLSHFYTDCRFSYTTDAC